MSMQPAGPQAITSATSLELKPGGLHIMLMNLNHDLAIGDSLSLTLQFGRVGSKSLSVPIQLQQ
jgi:copper(I)-binding protein